MWTLDEATRRRYVQGMTRLSIWYVFTLLQRGEVQRADLPRALCRRVNLYRFTDFWDGSNDADDGSKNSAWMELAKQMSEQIRDTATGGEEALEGRVLGLLEPTLEARLPKDIGPPPVRPFGCWTYELGWAGLADQPGPLGALRNPTHLSAIVRRGLRLPQAPSPDGVLHIMNVMAPRSMFEDMPRLALSLRKLIEEVRRLHPQVRTLWCNTWLNEHPKFRELLPEAWFRSGVVSPPGHYRNWWGQFARRDGDFNETAGRRLRETGGVFPFRALLCHAPMNEVDEFLRSHFGQV